MVLQTLQCFPQVIFLLFYSCYNKHLSNGKSIFLNTTWKYKVNFYSDISHCLYSSSALYLAKLTCKSSHLSNKPQLQTSATSWNKLDIFKQQALLYFVQTFCVAEHSSRAIRYVPWFLSSRSFCYDIWTIFVNTLSNLSSTSVTKGKLLLVLYILSKSL